MKLDLDKIPQTFLYKPHVFIVEFDSKFNVWLWRVSELYKSHKSLEDDLRALKNTKTVGTVKKENEQLQFELTVLQDENHKLKEMIREAESRVISSQKNSTPVPPQRHKSKPAASSPVTQLKRPVQNGDTPEIYL